MEIRHFGINQKEIDAIEIRSEEVQEIMEKAPSGIIRYGTSLFFLIAILLIIGSFFFRYPDTIEGRFYIVSTNSPVRMVAKKSGKITCLTVNDREDVEKGQLLAGIEDAADWQDVLWLDSILTPSSAKDSLLVKVLKLGELQNGFATWIKADNDYKDFTLKNYYPEKIRVLEERYQIFRTYLSKLKEQHVLLTEESQLVKQEFARDSLLFQKQVIAEADFNQSGQKLLQMKQSLRNSEVGYANAEMNFNEVKEALIDLKMEYNEQHKQRKLAVDESIENLKGTISEWKNKNFLISPIGGNVSFSRVWVSNQFVQEGQLVMNVVPRDQTKLTGKITMPVERSGKVRQGQPVNLKFDNYPSNEYGMIQTTLENISQVPDSFYIVTINLRDSLVTNYGKTIPFGQNMQGTAEIITDDLSLFNRLMNPIKALIRKHM